MTCTDLIVDNSYEEMLRSAIRNYYDGGLNNENFVKDAHRIYNEYVGFPCSLPQAEHHYLLGIIFSGFARYYEDNIDYYTCIMENALYCFFKVINESTSQSERQCAAIRMLLLIDGNDWVMKGITRKFRDKHCQKLYGQPLMHIQIISQGLSTPWDYENDILRIIGCVCLEMFGSSKTSFISHGEMMLFDRIKSSGKYTHSMWGLANMPDESVFQLYYEFITEYINTPYERRLTQLVY